MGKGGPTQSILPGTGENAKAGWRARFASMFLGAASVLALPPFSLWPILFLTLPLWVRQLDSFFAFSKDGPSRFSGPRLRRAFGAGWWFGFGYFLAGLYWVGGAFLVEGEMFAWAMPLAIMILPAGLALFYGLGTTLASLGWQKGPARLVSLAMGFLVAEWLRGHLFTGFPWNALGYALAQTEALRQSAALFGLYGLTFWALLIFASPVLLLETNKGSQRKYRLAFGLLLGLLPAAYLWGAWRLASVSPGVVAEVGLRIVQPNIPQSEKWKPANRQWIFSRLLSLSRAPSGANVPVITHVIWPESAIPFLLARSPEALAKVRDMLGERRSLLTGALRLEFQRDFQGNVTGRRVFNSILLLEPISGGSDGRPEQLIRAHYDKKHLVPFGEYLPFQGFLEAVGLQQLTRIRGGLTPGTGKRYLAPSVGPALLPLICYEIIFPGHLRDGETRPQWILNVTNDAWYGISPGPYQHLQQAQLRAVEEGLPVVRAANTGISAVIDPLGRIVRKLSLGQKGIIDSPLPAALSPPPYARYGDILLVFLLGFAAALWPFLTRTFRDEK